MTILVALNHITHYRYDRPAILDSQTVRLRPAPHVRSAVQSYSLKISPERHFLNWQQDPFGNFLGRVVFPERVSEFKIEVDLLTQIRPFNPFDFFLEKYAERFPFSYETELEDELAPYLEIKERGPALTALVERLKPSSAATLDFLVGVNRAVNEALAYEVRFEPGVQSCEVTLERKCGSCRDMAWLMCQILRHMGLATRFASGYLIQLAPDIKSLDGPSGADKDFTDLHAWMEVYLPGAGWVGLDATSGLFAGEGHIPLCCTPSPLSAAPVTGAVEKNTKVDIRHEMSVTRVFEEPRVTKPYSEAEWQAIDTLGGEIDEALSRMDVRLTMGGEPTFVSLDDRQDNAWHYDALGGEKKRLGQNMLNALNRRFSKGGLHMFTQGKWYPGEILPRWAMPSFWRRDGEPIWSNLDLLADPDTPLGHSTDTAKAFLVALAERFGIPESYVLSAHEDTPYYLWKERKLPRQDEFQFVDVYERAERERLRFLLENNINAPVGYVLPLHYSHRRERWISNKWQFGGPHLVLLTGDSPIGLRLPLGSLPFPEEAAEEYAPERSPFAMNEPLPGYDELHARIRKPDLSERELISGDDREDGVQGSGAAGAPLPTHAALEEQVRATSAAVDDAAFKDDPNGLIRSAISAEVRKGVLHIFLPPFAWVEHALELIAAIESVAVEKNLPIVLEGYTPPNDSRLANFSVTPDPGVIEINIQPATDWQELKEIIQGVYEEARLARLTAEKFMIDGKRVGTGGGNHIVMGAGRPEDSPFLRRPDLLRSMVSFWQNHPSLSYLFSGMYIGPTSQSPRIDEARHDSLYELELAFEQTPKEGETPPWLVDRIFRNLLVDLTGNTHRAEFCIDKLYSPDSDRGRLGLLEMRGFEMTPHPQMSLVQNLLLRACIALFWEKPYTNGLVRWGTRLHDRFVLPRYLREDFQAVLNFLEEGGYDLPMKWFAPFFAFRFPEYGRVQIGDATIILNSALEPWPVLGEEHSGGGVSRAVDATVERLQVTVMGHSIARHIVTCNGRRVPLQPGAENNTEVAGVRYKAWIQPSSLHPRLAVNAPLVFDLIDFVQGRSLGGCTYHVSHPGGRSYDTYPVNESEASGRMLARFQPSGHTPGKIAVPELEPNPEYPYTLDMRRHPP